MPRPRSASQRSQLDRRVTQHGMAGCALCLKAFESRCECLAVSGFNRFLQLRNRPGLQHGQEREQIQLFSVGRFAGGPGVDRRLNLGCHAAQRRERGRPVAGQAGLGRSGESKISEAHVFAGLGGAAGQQQHTGETDDTDGVFVH
jgi:hypothetical protein